MASARRPRAAAPPPPPLLLLPLLFLLLTAASASEEDFAFEPEDSPPPNTPAAAVPGPLRRLWGVPDAVAWPGRLLRLVIPADAFSAPVRTYQVSGPSGRRLPSWLLFDEASGVFEGVPSEDDVGEYYVTVKADGYTPHDSAKDVFSVEVLPKPITDYLPVDASAPMKCDHGEEPTFLTIVLDVDYNSLKPRQRVSTIKNLAGFLGLHHGAPVLEPFVERPDLLGDAVVMAGPGSLRRRSSRRATALRWQVGCEGRVWSVQQAAVAELRTQALDGTLAEVLQLPVVGWHAGVAPRRDRREVGSGDYDDEDVPSGYDGDTVPEARVVPTMSSPSFPEATASSHPHRHHHGESASVSEPQPALRPPTSPAAIASTFTILPTPVVVPMRPTHLSSLEPSRAYEAGAIPSATPIFSIEGESSSSSSSSSQVSYVTDPLPTWDVANDTELSASPSPSQEESEPTPPLPTSTITSEQPVVSPATEEVEYGVRNIPPTIEHRLPKLPVTAGKALRYIVPEDVFSDLEDGNTRNLRLVFKTTEGTLVPPSYWVQFDSEKQEVYALPLEEQVSRWTFVIEAMDREGKTVSDNLELMVQHHKGRRTVNHEFSLQLRIEKKGEFPTAVDWQLMVLDRLAALYGDPDTSRITVRNLTVVDPFIFTWTNDSLPRSHCPKEDIDRLYKRLVSNGDGEPSKALRDLLAPEIKVKKVSFHGIGQCELATKPEEPLAPPPSSHENFPPVPRNQVDHIKATVGELLVFVVPEDSFYDPEEGNARNMRLSLLTMDRTPISQDNWLQFDEKNQEFYGIPLPSDVGSEEYQLVCKDKEGLSANDGLVVEVLPAPKVPYTVEFVATLDVPYHKFANSATDKRKFIEKLRDLFGDRDASAVVLGDVRAGSTVVTWYNKTLPTNSCPQDEVRVLRRALLDSEGRVSERAGEIMGPEFPLQDVQVIPTGLCQGEYTLTHPIEERPPASEEPAPGASDDYLVTFVVPAAVIAGMLLLAGLVACALYRRRRSSKMAAGDEDERQSFRNKGIPVIFQDELEERPEPENKSPVIMKEEKPPLPPPEYRGAPPPEPEPAEDAPYRPPPPFAAAASGRDSGRGSRPKPTPTYRKPPPYVPP